VPWGIKALSGYLGDQDSAWREHDAVALINDGARVFELLIDQGDADQFLTERLRPELLERACSSAGIPLTLTRHAGYDHSYYFISTFMEDHLRWHARRLKA
jgi:S-formylglutathione hydrolase